MNVWKTSLPILVVLALTSATGQAGPAGDAPTSVTATNLPGIAAPSVSSRFPGATNWMVARRAGWTMGTADTNALPTIIKQDGRSYLNLTFARLSGYHFDENPALVDAGLNPYASYHARDQVPVAVKNLGEQPAAITGFMLPLRMTNGLATDFLLLRNQSACCLGIMPHINEYVVAHTVGPGIKPLMDVPVTALGTFHVGELRENGHLIGIYVLDCERMLPAQ